MRLKEIIRNISRIFGIEISKYRPENTEMAKLQKMLSYHSIDLILDVGANTGQFAKTLRSEGFKGKIISFEPLSDAHKMLLKQSKNDDDWTVAPRMAIGNKEEISKINISENSVSSSIKPMTIEHVEVAPASHYIGTEEIKVSRLDCACKEFLNDAKNVFLKIDTQGFEQQVLQGAEGIMPLVKGIQIELSLIPLYEEQMLFGDMVDKLNTMGFHLSGLSPCMTDPRTGTLLQVDGILFRNPL